MDWTTILRNAGIPDSPGRQEAIEATAEHVALRRAAAAKSNRPGKKR